MTSLLSLSVEPESVLSPLGEMGMVVRSTCSDILTRCGYRTPSGVGEREAESEKAKSRRRNGASITCRMRSDIKGEMNHGLLPRIVVGVIDGRRSEKNGEDREEGEGQFQDPASHLEVGGGRDR